MPGCGGLATNGILGVEGRLKAVCICDTPLAAPDLGDCFGRLTEGSHELGGLKNNNGIVLCAHSIEIVANAASAQRIG